jgi:protein-disulfide isomerase
MSKNMVARVVDAALTPVLLACALTVTGLLIRREFFSGSSQPATSPTGPIIGRPALEIARLGPGRLIGDSAASVRLIEFADFQCPFCVRAAAALKDLRARYPERFVVEFHHLAIPAHPHARDAAEASECAGEQGKFESFYYLVFENQSKVGVWSWREFAKRASVENLEAFDACFSGRRFAQRVDADMKAATQLGVRGTPTWLLRDSLFGGLPPVPQLEGWVAQK